MHRKEFEALVRSLLKALAFEVNSARIEFVDTDFGPLASIDTEDGELTITLQNQAPRSGFRAEVYGSGPWRITLWPVDKR